MKKKRKSNRSMRRQRKLNRLKKERREKKPKGELAGAVEEFVQRGLPVNPEKLVAETEEDARAGRTWEHKTVERPSGVGTSADEQRAAAEAMGLDPSILDFKEDGTFRVKNESRPEVARELPERKRGPWEAEFRAIMERGIEGPFKWLWVDRRVVAKGVVELLNGNDLGEQSEGVCKRWTREIRTNEARMSQHPFWSKFFPKTGSALSSTV